jgi:hypothetical protein
MITLCCLLLKTLLYSMKRTMGGGKASRFCLPLVPNPGVGSGGGDALRAPKLLDPYLSRGE